MNNLDVFHDTERRIQNDARLRSLTEKAESETSVIWGGFHSDKAPDFGETNIEVRDCLTLMSARELARQSSRVAVLNFANPVEPGGGVLRGASAQEEYLCRAGNLYKCLTCSNAVPYYQYHAMLFSQQARQDVIPFTDAIVYSRGVTVIRDDAGYYGDGTGYGSPDAVQQYTPHWYSVDMITCAAPMVKNKFVPQLSYSAPTDAQKEQIRLQDQMQLAAVFRLRIANILESAIDAAADSLVLGAFGCGAFHNSPYLVATAYKDILSLDRYKNSFRNIHFAIKRTGEFCPNIEAFELAFSGISAERNKRRFFM